MVSGAPWNERGGVGGNGGYFTYSNNTNTTKKNVSIGWEPQRNGKNS